MENFDAVEKTLNEKLIESLIEDIEKLQIKKPESEHKCNVPNSYLIRKLLLGVFIFQIFTTFVDPEYRLINGIEHFITNKETLKYTEVDEVYNVDVVNEDNGYESAITID
jgi:hypothetical protein